MWTSNQWGASQKSSYAAVTVRGNSPSTPRITSILAEKPNEFRVNFAAPSDAESVDITVNCESFGKRVFSDITASNTSHVFSDAKAGDRCSAAVTAKNAWGKSNMSAFAGPVLIKGKAPSESPSGVAISTSIGKFSVSWNDAPDASSVDITLICSVSGTRRVNVNASVNNYNFSAEAGETCYAQLVSKNDWGVASSPSRSNQAAIPKPVKTSPSNSSSNPNSSPKPNSSTATPKSVSSPTKPPKATSGSMSSLVCIKGSQRKTVTALKPTCPAGWVKKPTISKG